MYRSQWGEMTPFADRVIPAGHVSDHGQSETPGDDEKRNGVPRLDVREDERRALALHRLEELARHVPARTEMPPLHGALEEREAGQRSLAVGVEHPIRVAGRHALLVEPVPVVEPDRERVVPDPAVEPRVEPAPHAKSCVRRELVAEEHRNVTESRAPLGCLFSRDQKNDGKPPAQAIVEQVDDPGVEEHADRELVGEDEPGSLHVRTPSCAAMRPASEAPSSRWKRSTSSGVPHAGQPSTP